MTTNTNSRLKELRGSDYEIADGQPNIKGWDVKNAQGKTIGEVDELIFDTQALKVRYIVLELRENVSDMKSRNVLVPIGLAELHKEDDEVILPSVSADQFSALPDYKKDTITDQDETSIRIAFAGAGLAAGNKVLQDTDSSTGDFYDHQHFDENSLYKRRNQQVPENATSGTIQDPASFQIIEENLKVGKKTVETGGVRLNSRIVEKPVEKDIQLREETVRVDRAEVNRPATEADFKEGTVEVREYAEVPVISKEAYVIEELKFNKEVSEKEEIIKDTVRSTEVNVEKLNDDELKGSSDIKNRL